MLIQISFCKSSISSWIRIASSSKKRKNRTDIDMLLMVEKGIKGEICRSIYRYAKATNINMEDYDKNKELSCL